MPVIIFVIFLIAVTQSWWLIGYLGLLLWLEWLGVRGWRMMLAVIATWLLVTLGVVLAPDSSFAALIGWSHRGLILWAFCAFWACWDIRSFWRCSGAMRSRFLTVRRDCSCG